MNKRINVTITGLSNSGKSTIMRFIWLQLLKNGFDAEISLDGNLDYKNISEFHLIEGSNFNEKLEALKQKTKITLIEQQVNSYVCPDED